MTNHSRPPGRPVRRPGLWLLAVLVALTPLAAKAVRDAGSLLADASWRYADTNAPMLTSHDGYAFLAAAEAPAAAGPVPALSRLVAGAARLTGTTPQQTAFWLPPLLAGLLPLAVFVWGRRLFGDPAALAAALAAGTCPYFLEVTALGRCDTDGLIPTLFLSAALAAQSAATACGRLRWQAAALYALAVFLAWWWWKPGGYLAATLLPLALLAVPGEQGRSARALGLGLIALGAAAALATAWGLAAVLPAPLAAPLDYALRHTALALGLTADTGSVARSVIELRPLTLAELGRRSLGHPALLALAALGMARLWRTDWRTALLLSPLLAAGAAALRSGRLVLLFFPLAALGFGAALDWLAGRARLQAVAGPPARAALTLCAAGLLLLPAFRLGLTAPNRPPFGRDDDGLALAAGRLTPPGTVLWAWWDDGYFLRYRANRPVFFDGGSQTSEDCFVAAWPLAASDAGLAADWIRFFAAHGPGELGRLAGRFGSRDAAVAYLVRLFASPAGERPAVLAELPGTPPGGADPAAYCFPHAPACLILRPDLMNKSGFWLAFAASPQARVPASPPNHVDMLPKTGLLVEAAAGRVRLPDAALAKGYAQVPTVWDVQALAPLPERLAGRADPILFYSDRQPLVAIADQAAARSLALRLLLAPDAARERFAAIASDPLTGGAWMVLPGPGAP